MCRAAEASHTASPLEAHQCFLQIILIRPLVAPPSPCPSTRPPPHPTQPAVPSAPSPCPVLPAAACFLQHHQRAPLSTRVWAHFSFSVAPSSVRAKAPALPGTLCLHPSRPPPPPCSPSLTWLQPPHLFLHTPSPKGLLWASAVAVAPAWNAVPWRLHGFSLPLLRDFSHNCPL